MKTCSECDKPLFDQDYADPNSGLCDECWIRETEEMDDGAYDEVIDNELSFNN